MPRDLLFANLPFTPVPGQVIYMEQSFHSKTNAFILENYQELIAIFLSEGLEFCYLPLLTPDIIRYHAPYLNPDDWHTKTEQFTPLSNYLVSRAPSSALLFVTDTVSPDSNGNIRMKALPIRRHFFTSTKSVFEKLAKKIKRLTPSLRHQIFTKITRLNLVDSTPIDFDDSDVKYCLIDSPNMGPRPKPVIDADTNFDEQSRQLIFEIKLRINALRNRGVNTMVLHHLIDENPQLSELYITRDFRILLPNYNNLEIKLPLLPKAVFFLFIRHPEGIRFKTLADHYTELLNIYQTLKPNGSLLRQQQSVSDITNPCSNSINEKCSRIREAFVKHFDDSLAKNYYVTGNRGEAKRITLPPSLIKWENPNFMP